MISNLAEIIAHDFDTCPSFRREWRSYEYRNRKAGARYRGEQDIARRQMRKTRRREVPA